MAEISTQTALEIERCKADLVQILDRFGIDLSNQMTWEQIIDNLNNYDENALVNKLLSKTYAGSYRNSTLTSIGARAFQDFQGITILEMPNVINIGASACSGCIGLEDIDIFSATEIGNFALQNCSNLPIISVPNNTSANTEIVSNAMTNLRIVDYGKPTTMNWLYTNGNKPNFEYLVLRNTSLVTLSNVNRFNTTKFITGGGKCFVPNSLIYTYQTASNWSALSGTTYIALEGSRFENIRWKYNCNSQATLDGRIVDVLDNETVAIFKHTENISHCYENGVELQDTDLVKGKTLTSTI